MPSVAFRKVKGVVDIL